MKWLKLYVSLSDDVNLGAVCMLFARLEHLEYQQEFIPKKILE